MLLNALVERGLVCIPSVEERANTEIYKKNTEEMQYNQTLQETYLLSKSLKNKSYTLMDSQVRSSLL